jgi:hypothetical protein
MTGLRDVRGTLEHHMFEEMCEARTAVPFVPRTDIIINCDRDNGHRIIPIQDDSQPICKRVFLDLKRRKFESFGHKLERRHHAGKYCCLSIKTFRLRNCKNNSFGKMRKTQLLTIR